MPIIVAVRILRDFEFWDKQLLAVNFDKDWIELKALQTTEISTSIVRLLYTNHPLDSVSS